MMSGVSLFPSPVSPLPQVELSPRRIESFVSIRMTLSPIELSDLFLRILLSNFGGCCCWSELSWRVAEFSIVGVSFNTVGNLPVDS